MWSGEPRQDDPDATELAMNIGADIVRVGAPCGTNDIANGTFVAHARTDIPDLIAEVRRLQSLLKDGVTARVQYPIELPGGVGLNLASWSTKVDCGLPDDTIIHLTARTNTYLGHLTLGWFRKHTTFPLDEQAAREVAAAADGPEEDEPDYCRVCDGTGEGRASDTRCGYCRGTGFELRRMEVEP